MTRTKPKVSSFASSAFFGFILFILKVTRPTVMKKATPYCYLVGVYTPLRVPTMITGMTLALLLNTTNGTLTYRIALLLKFILINPKNATTISSQVND